MESNYCLDGSSETTGVGISERGQTLQESGSQSEDGALQVQSLNEFKVLGDKKV